MPTKPRGRKRKRGFMAELNRKVNKKKWFPTREQALEEKNKLAIVKPTGALKEEPVTFKGP